jgi:MoaA/NifB/PqqE/SkfB family radical SAM enzyme
MINAEAVKNNGVQYGFYGRLKKSFPSQIIVDATEVCNLACIHCPHPEFKQSEHYSARYLDIHLHNKMIDEVRESGKGNTLYIRYTSNGEPLIHPKIYDMLDYAVTNSGVLITLTTNGTILNEKKVEKLLQSGLHLIDVSIDAYYPETYAKIRVNGDLSVTSSNVDKLIEMRNRNHLNTRIVVSFVEQKDNSDEAGMFEQYWKERGADYVIIRRLHSAAGGVSMIADGMREQQKTTDRFPCLYPWERITLNPRGELCFCPQDWLHGSVLTSYSDTTIKEIWQSEMYENLRRAHLTNNFCDQKFCGNCPDWKQTRWPGEGRSYADMIEDFITEGQPK